MPAEDLPDATQVEPAGAALRPGAVRQPVTDDVTAPAGCTTRAVGGEASGGTIATGDIALIIAASGLGFS